MNANQNNNKKLSKVISTKLSIEDYNAFLTITKLEYEAGLIKQQSTSELLRFTIRHILNQIHNNLIYPILEEEQQEQEQKRAQSNQQQQLVNPVNLQPTTAGHHHAPKLYQTSNLQILKTSSAISLLPIKTNASHMISVIYQMNTQKLKL
jgi:hypothetical protein